MLNHVNCSSVHNTKICKQPTYASADEWVKKMWYRDRDRDRDGDRYIDIDTGDIAIDDIDTDID